jgi:hypothetical protein
MPNPVRLALSAAPLVVLVCSTGAAAPAGFTYRYFKESRPLALDASRVAVFRADGVAARGVGVSIDSLAAPADTQLRSPRSRC